MQLFSPVQFLGYGAFVLGVAAFLQKTDRRLKILNANQCLVYSLHFVLLGNSSACASSLISALRSFLAVRTRSPWLAASIIAMNLAAGTMFARSGAGWLPVIASCAATVAIFCMQGIPMRLVLLGCTLLWLANNVLSGSIGGTLLELVIAVINLLTMIRMLRPDTTATCSCDDAGNAGTLCLYPQLVGSGSLNRHTRTSARCSSTCGSTCPDHGRRPVSG
jgi:hypothetical protein